ncbi:hypothetical protein I4641_17260 [Waterburya agarophytonicola K14]|uniref:Uncharacterized protein n=1 Tax=Waterburya agarophytonicola KI4 TaxID=2874699 RepID=A0A964FH53_9CYAN|nr:hypothetical protein [Waterburya agarophytonicola]MCC0178722.1 hypothetical protein [Waterburya agarophytonicola KI4]
MIIKVNFAPEGSTTLDGFITDYGAEYSPDRGFGWVIQSSLEDENPTPVDISPNTRDRISNSDVTGDTLIHLQYPTDLISPLAAESIKIPSAWEYDIANGSYLVTVGVGDPDFVDSTHVVNVEGESLISNFVPTEDNLFAENTTLVEVTDGRLTIDAIGGENTKLTFVEIASEGNAELPADNGESEESETPVDTGDGDGDGESEIETPVDTGDGDGDGDGEIETPVDTGDTVRINFAPASAFSPEGYIQDIGGEYNDDRGYGWITQDSVGSDNPTPINISPNTRDRNSVVEDSFDSLIHLQYGDAFENDNAIRTPSAWEYELANGEYTVTVGVGDPQFEDSNHVINIEGNSIIAGFVPTEDNLFAVKTSTVEVTDGKLTIDAIGGENTKLNFVEIAPSDGSEITDPPIDVTPIEIPTEVPIPVEGGGVVEMVEPIADGININFGVATVDSAAGFTQDIGAAYNSDRGYGWVTQDSAGSDNPTPINLFANARDRNTLFNNGQGGVFQEPVQDSLIHLQYPTGLGNSETAVTTPAAWEHAVENGRYEVTVGVGDPDFFDSEHTINVEGESAISGFIPTGTVENGFLPLDAQAFATGTVTVDVTDGRLTIDAIGGENTKINYVSIIPITDI